MEDMQTLGPSNKMFSYCPLMFCYSVNIDWEHFVDLNTIHSLVTNGAGTENRPNIFYFGIFDDIHGCAAMCLAESQCVVSQS